MLLLGDGIVAGEGCSRELASERNCRDDDCLIEHLVACKESGKGATSRVDCGSLAKERREGRREGVGKRRAW